MKLNKKTSLPLLLTLASSLVCSTFVADAYQPVEVKVPFTFKNFEREDAPNYSLTISEKGSSKVSSITYRIENPNEQYYTMSFNEPGSYSYVITFTDKVLNKIENYNLQVEINRTSDDSKLLSGFYITKTVNGVKKKVPLEFEEEDTPSTPSDKPSDTPSNKPSDKPSDTPSTTPSDKPSDIPSWRPSDNPSTKPSDTPSNIPSGVPSDTPSIKPSDNPSVIPSGSPSDTPSGFPSSVPSSNPSGTPSVKPSNNPSITVSENPSQVIVVTPSNQNPSHSGVQTGDNYLPILTIGGIGTMFLTVSVVLFKRKK